MKAKPQVILKDGRPSAVIIKISDYRDTPMSFANLLVPREGFFFLRFLIVIQSSILATFLLLSCLSDRRQYNAGGLVFVKIPDQFSMISYVYC